jgi:hypothetical protein
MVAPIPTGRPAAPVLNGGPASATVALCRRAPQQLPALPWRVPVATGGRTDMTADGGPGLLTERARQALPRKIRAKTRRSARLNGYSAITI